MRKKIMLALCGLTSPVLFAQDTLKTTTTLREVIFSASRDYQPLLAVPRSASIINREAIEKSVYNSVGELLSAQEGIYVVGATQTPGTNQSLFMRGANGNQVAVMIDGKRITDPSSPNSSIDLSELSLANVERIEIIRGSHTTAYGGAAVGGVINVITKKGSEPGFHGSASLQAGTFGEGSLSLVEQADANYAFGNGAYVQGSVFNQDVSGLDASAKTGGTDFSTHDEDDFKKTDGSVKAGYSNAKWDGSVSYKKSYQDADIDAGAFSDDDNSTLTFERDLFDYQVNTKLNGHLQLTALGSWSRSQRISKNDSSVIDENGNTDRSYFKGNYRGELQTHELQLNYTQGLVTGVAGAGVFSEDMKFNTYYFSNAFGPFELITNYDTLDTRTTTSYGFGKLSYQVQKFNLSAGARLSHHTTFGNYFTFELNPSVKLYETALLYASVSSGFNAPSLYQLYDPTQGFDAYAPRGNKDLEPEQSLSLEVGFKTEFKNGSYLTFSAFQTSVKNSIEYVYLWDGSVEIDALDFSHYRGDRYMNIARQSMSGLEFLTRIVFTQVFSMNANMSFLQPDFETSPSDLTIDQTGNHHVQIYSNGSFLDETKNSDFLQRRPKVTANLQLAYKPMERLSLTAGYRYAASRFDAIYDNSLGPFGALGKAEVQAYNLLDLAAVWSMNKQFTINMKVENLLDEDYSEILGFSTRGRSVYLKLIFKW